MHEIKFRAWDKAYKKMITDFLAGNQRLAISFKGEIFSFTDWERVDYDPEKMYNGSNYLDRFVLMQYTGLKDRNGVEIYNGDVLRRDTYWGFYIGYKDGSYVCIPCDPVQRVNWDWWPITQNKAKNWEVIGNIYDNPGLLKKE